MSNGHEESINLGGADTLPVPEHWQCVVGTVWQRSPGPQEISIVEIMADKDLPM
jgi:hypothetical protein